MLYVYSNLKSVSMKLWGTGREVFHILQDAFILLHAEYHNLDTYE